MITPIEIEEKDFSKKMRGYDMDEVDEFLDLIILDLQDLLVERETLLAENQKLKEENEEHIKSQKHVMETLDSAKRLMKDISDSAEKRADIIIQNAKMDAEIILNNARGAAPELPEDNGNELYERINLFKSRYRQLLQDELNNLDNASHDLLTDLEREFMPGGMGGSITDFSALEELDRQSKDELRKAEDLMSKLETEVEEFKSRSMPKPKDTVVLDSKAIDELLKKKNEKLAVANNE